MTTTESAMWRRETAHGGHFSGPDTSARLAARTPPMTAGWRKSSHSSHAGDNCVEIALSVPRRTEPRSPAPARGYMVNRRDARRWFVSTRA